MIVNLTIKDNQIVGYRTYPISLEKVYVEVDSIPHDLLKGAYQVQDHHLVKIEKTNSFSQKQLQSAFEKYKNDVIYGVVTETEQRHQELLKWYQKLGANNADSLSNPPKEILSYLGEA